MTVPRRYAVVLSAYLAALLAIDTQVSLDGQLVLSVLTFVVLGAALWPLAPLVRAQAVGVVLFATIGEVTGSLVWGVYHYRLHNLPLFIPPAHGLVYAAGTLKPKRWSFSSGPFLSSIRRREPIGTISASGASSSRASVT